MNRSMEQLRSKVKLMLEGEEISLLFDMVKKDLANQILLTKPNESEKREELYLTANGVDLLSRKMMAISYEETD